MKMTMNMAIKMIIEIIMDKGDYETMEVTMKVMKKVPGYRLDHIALVFVYSTFSIILI